MEQNEIKEQPVSQTTTGQGVAVITPSQEEIVTTPPVKQSPCPTCDSGAASVSVSYVYAIGRIEARFPRLSVEKEFAQAIGRAETKEQTDQQAFHNALSKRENRYLARQMCWVFTIQGLETYLLQPRDPGDFDRLVEAIQPQLSPMDIVSSSECGDLLPHRRCVMGSWCPSLRSTRFIPSVVMCS